MAYANVYCIVVTYNGSKWIEKCFSSLLTSTVPLQIIAIDNASPDNTVTLIKEKFPSVNVIEAEGNLGFGQANNIGLKKALQQNADYVFLLNQDAFITPDCIDILIKASIANNEYGILSPFHLSYDGNDIEDYFKKFIVAFEAPNYISDLYFGNTKKVYSVSFVHAAGWLMPIETVEKIGGFDPLFYHYGEDNDYVQRVLFRNYKIGFVPDAIMHHKGTNSVFVNQEVSILFKRNFATIHLKNPKASFNGAMLVFTKNIFDGITSAIAYRNLKRLKEEWKLAAAVLKSIRQIKKSRLVQLTDMAYLNS